MIEKEKTICFTGHRSRKMPQTEEGIIELRQAIYDAVDKAIENGIDTFITGVCHGFDLMAAEMVFYRRRTINQNDAAKIKVIAAIPFKGQADKWSDINRSLYNDILQQCDMFITMHVKYKPSCYYDRNRWMVDNSCGVIAYYNGGLSGTQYTIKYAEKSGIPITNLYDYGYNQKKDALV